MLYYCENGELATRPSASGQYFQKRRIFPDPWEDARHNKADRALTSRAIEAQRNARIPFSFGCSECGYTGRVTTTVDGIVQSRPHGLCARPFNAQGQPTAEWESDQPLAMRRPPEPGF